MGDCFLNEPSHQTTARERLAATIGLELSYETIWGHTHHVSQPTERAIVEALTGEPIDTSNDHAPARFLARHMEQAAAELLHTRTLVEWVGAPLESASIQLTPDESASEVELHIRWENGTSTVCSPSSPQLKRLATPGYHSLTIRTPLRQSSARWILTPAKCVTPAPGQQLNGINCFLPSLRSNRNWGAGDFTDLVEFARQLRAHTAFDFVALNPLHAIHNRAPYNTSPYLPLSIFTRNLLYLDIESIPEFQSSTWARRIAATPAFQSILESLRDSEWVHYERIARIKTFFLALLYRQFRRDKTLDQYRAERGHWLDNYCTYKAFDRYFHRRNPDVWHWHQWPAAFQSPASPESQALRHQLRRQIDFYAYIEMCIDRQVGAAHQQLRDIGYSVGLYQDLALATDRVGADYWAYQELFAPRVRVGSPPDDFNENGQDWGFPALHPQRHCDSGYRYFIESIRCAAQHAGAIRLDHVMRLARLYWIPDNMSARNGAYVRDRFEDLLRILALESQRGNFIVVGEDLGTVPDYFRRALDDSGILSYRLILFERDGSRFRAPEHYPQQAIASFTTHDLPAFDGWLQGKDLEARIATGQLPQAELEAARQSRVESVAELRSAFQLTPDDQNAESFFAGLCDFLATTPSQLRLLNLEELTAESEQQNMPGTTSEAPNWQRKLKTPLEQLFNDSRFLARVRVWNQAIHSRRPR